MFNKCNCFIYPWLIDSYYKIIYIFKNNYINSFNFVVYYSTDLCVDMLIISFVKWIFCKNKINNISCNKCLFCKLINKNKFLNFYFINYKINIFDINKIFINLFKNMNIYKFKIIYFSNFDFSNYYVNNFLLNILEKYYNNFIFIFSCFEYIYIPETLYDRLYKFKLNFPKENYIIKLFSNLNLFSKYDKFKILSSIRLSNNSPLFSIKLLKKFFLYKYILLNCFLNIKSFNFNYIVNILSFNSIKFNLYFLMTLFIDFIRIKLNNLKYLYNIDLINLIKRKIKYFDIKNIFLILNKIIKCDNDIRSIKNINKNILIYNLVSFIFIKNYYI